MCVSDIAPWCRSRWMQFNLDITEFVWFGSRANLKKLNIRNSSLQVSSIEFSVHVHLNTELSIKQPVAKLLQYIFTICVVYVPDLSMCRL